MHYRLPRCSPSAMARGLRRRRPPTTRISSGRCSSRTPASSVMPPSSGGPASLRLRSIPGGARFELWTVAKHVPIQSYLLDTRYVGTYVPLGSGRDPQRGCDSLTPSTRADRPFYVDVTVSGLLSGARIPSRFQERQIPPSRPILWSGGTGIGIDRTQATLCIAGHDQRQRDAEPHLRAHSVSRANRAKIRGRGTLLGVFAGQTIRRPSRNSRRRSFKFGRSQTVTISGITTEPDGTSSRRRPL